MHLDIKRFKQEVADYLEIPITYANMAGWDVKDQFDVCKEAKAFKVGVHPLCTNRIKTAPFHKWLADTFPTTPGSYRDDVIIYYGFEAGEPARVAAQYPAGEGISDLFPAGGVAGPYQKYPGYKDGAASDLRGLEACKLRGLPAGGAAALVCGVYRRPDVWAKAKHAEDVIGYSILRVNNKLMFLKELDAAARGHAAAFKSSV